MKVNEMSKPQFPPSPLAGEGASKRRERGNSQPHILIFDSGLGGMSVYAEITKALPRAKFSYLADDAVFPYGSLTEIALIARVMELMEHYIPKLAPDVVVIACNTASTLVLPSLRAKFSLPFVGTVPAIKPAATRTKSGMFSVLATPGTVARDYTKDLIRLYASDCHVTLVGAPNLARIAEEYIANEPPLFLLPFMGAKRADLLSPLEGEGGLAKQGRMGGIKTNSNLQSYFTKEKIAQTCALPSHVTIEKPLNLPSPLEGAEELNLPSPLAFERDPKGRIRGILISQIRAEIAPAFIEKNNTRTDIIVLACTHYPLILPLLQESAAWQVEWINPAEAIARRVAEIVKPKKST